MLTLPVTSFKDLCLDAADPLVVGRFWAAALGQQLEVHDDGDTAVTGPNFLQLWIDAVPEPKVVKNRVHLDLSTDDVEAEVARLVALGAAVAAAQPDDGLVVMHDPEGNEFCVLR